MFSWTGFYIGLNGGYSWGRSRTTGTLSNATTGAVLATGVNSFNLNGGVFGGQSEETGSYYQGLNVFAGVLVGAAAGGVVGGVAGASVRTEVWSPVPIH